MISRAHRAGGQSSDEEDMDPLTPLNPAPSTPSRGAIARAREQVRRALANPSLGRDALLQTWREATDAIVNAAGPEQLDRLAPARAPAPAEDPPAPLAPVENAAAAAVPDAVPRGDIQAAARWVVSERAMLLGALFHSGKHSW